MPEIRNRWHEMNTFLSGVNTSNEPWQQVLVIHVLHLLTMRLLWSTHTNRFLLLLDISILLQDKHLTLYTKIFNNNTVINVARRNLLVWVLYHSARLSPIWICMNVWLFPFDVHECLYKFTSTVNFNDYNMPKKTVILQLMSNLHSISQHKH
jgi:hypothetical protein